MELGELGFTEEEFGKLSNWDVDFSENKAAEWANRILREKLAKAPEVRSDSIGRNAEWLRAERELYATHRARLVCIEAIASPQEEIKK